MFFALCNPTDYLFRHKISLPVHVSLYKFNCIMIFPQKGEEDKTLGPSSNPPVWLPVILPVNTLGTLDIKLLTVLTGTPVPSSCIISTMRSICQLKKFVNVLLSYKWQNWINIYFLYIFNLLCISIFKRSLKCTCEVDIWIVFIEYNCRNVVFTTTTTFSKKKKGMNPCNLYPVQICVQITKLQESCHCRTTAVIIVQTAKQIVLIEKEASTLIRLECSAPVHESDVQELVLCPLVFNQASNYSTHVLVYIYRSASKLINIHWSNDILYTEIKYASSHRNPLYSD